MRESGTELEACLYVVQGMSSKWEADVKHLLATRSDPQREDQLVPLFETLLDRVDVARDLGPKIVVAQASRRCLLGHRDADPVTHGHRVTGRAAVAGARRRHPSELDRTGGDRPSAHR